MRLILSLAALLSFFALAYAANDGAAEKCQETQSAATCNAILYR